MKWLGLSVFALGLVSGCEKAVPFENTKPADRSQVIPTVSLDGGFGSLDAQVAASSDGGGEPELPTQAFTKPALLKAIADCSLGRYREFNELASALRDATAAWAENPNEELRAAAQNAWRAANDSWQVSELFRFGPTGPAFEPGGKDYRNAIYFFPDILNCQVDQAIVSRSYAARPLNLLVSARGLGALEYLLFYNGSANSCGAGITINTGTPNPWQQLDAAELNRRRAEYAGALGDDLSVVAKAVLDAWDPAVGNFHAQFANAGALAGGVFKTDQDAFNVIDNAFFYIDRELKDYKLAIPAGLSLSCGSTVCPEAVEARFSLASNSNMGNNVRGFRSLFQGCGPNYSGLGFDDYLSAINKGDLAARMIAAAVDAQTSAATLPLPLEQLINADRGRVVALHTAVKGISDLLKTEFVSSLNLELPTAAQGDND
jgi:predicted lipoprotein